MSILVTGSAGFIGNAVTTKLLELGNDVIGIDNFYHSYDPKIKIDKIEALKEKFNNFTFYQTDASNHKDLKTMFDKHPKIDTIFHLVGPMPHIHSFDIPQEYENINITTTINLLDIIKDKNIKKLIYSSAATVYGETKKYPFIETHHFTKPTNPYSISKLAAENYLEAYSNYYAIPTVTFRIFAAYGPGMSPNSGMYNFIDQALNKSEVKNVHSNTLRDFIYIDDIVKAMISAINKRLGYQMINLGTGTSYSNIDVINIIAKIEKKEVKIQKTKATNEFDIVKQQANMNKAKKMLGFIPSTNIETL